jgi:hypothetical protein
MFVELFTLCEDSILTNDIYILMLHQICIFPFQLGQLGLNLPINMVFDAILTNDVYFNVPSYLFFSITIMAIRVGLAHNYCIMVLDEGWVFKPQQMMG